MAEGDHDKLDLIEELRRLSVADPFVPFDILMSSGDRAEVTTAGIVAIGRSIIHVFNSRSNAFDIVRANQIAGIRVHDAATN